MRVVSVLFVISFLYPNISKSLDFKSSRTMSLSEAGRGGALLNDTVTLNPSLLGFQNVSSFSGTFNWINAPAGPAMQQDRNFNVSIVDGKNPYAGAGISFTRRPDADFFHVGVAKKATSWLSFGTLIKRFSTRSNARSAQGSFESGFDGGVSAAFILPQSFLIPIQIGLTSDNLMGKAEHEPYTGPRQAAVGVKLNVLAMLMLYGDWVMNFSNNKGKYPTYSGGAELSLGYDIYIRGGLLGFRDKGWSYGGGWVGPKIGLSYGFQNKRDVSERSFQHAVTMDIYM